MTENMLVLIIIFSLGVFGMLYVGLVLYVHDISFKALNLTNFKDKRVLFIYAHPDDETMASGGFMALLAKKSRQSVWSISVTAGEKGIEKLDLDPVELGKIRKEEYALALKKLGISRSEIWSFPDGDLPAKQEDLEERISTFVHQNKIDVVVTHEKFGLYGHPDHIALSKAVHRLASKQGFTALYSTLPNKVLAKVKLPKTLTYKDKTVELSPEVITNPQFKLNIYRTLYSKYLAAKQFRSQDLSHGVPLAIMMAFGGFEYYTYEYPDNTI